MRPRSAACLSCSISSRVNRSIFHRLQYFPTRQFIRVHFLQEKAETRAKVERLQEASVWTNDLVWSSLLNNKARNCENLKELSADRERIKEGLAA